jgi:hypothetical protein
MALWGISTTTETEENRYGLPKHLSENDRENTPWNCFADNRGWVYRRYGTVEQSGLSTDYYDEVIVPVAGLNTAGSSTDTGATGLGTATPVAVFFEDPNQNSRISIAAGATDRIRNNGQTGYVHVVWNENVYCSAGATVLVVGVNTLGTGTTSFVATAASTPANCNVANYTNADGIVLYNTFNGQISNRVSFAFTANATGIGTILSINMARGVVGTITDFSGGAAVIKTFTSDILRNVGGAGTTGSVGIGTTTLTVTA